MFSIEKHTWHAYLSLTAISESVSGSYMQLVLLLCGYSAAVQQRLDELPISQWTLPQFPALKS